MAERITVVSIESFFFSLPSIFVGDRESCKA